MRISGIGSDNPLGFVMSIYGIDDRVEETITLTTLENVPTLMSMRTIYTGGPDGRETRGTVGTPAIRLTSSSLLYGWLQSQADFLDRVTRVYTG